MGRKRRRLTLAKTTNGVDVNVYLKQRKKYGKEDEFKKHVPLDAAKVSDEAFKNMLKEPERSRSVFQSQKRMTVLTSGDEVKVQCKGYIAGKV